MTLSPALVELGILDKDGSPLYTVPSWLVKKDCCAIAYLRGQTNIVQRHADFLKGSLRVDIFGLKEGGTIDGPLRAPLRLMQAG